MLSGWHFVYGVGFSLLCFELHNVIWLSLGKVEARFSQSISRKEIVARKDRPYVDIKPVWHQTTEPAVLMSTYDLHLLKYIYDKRLKISERMN